MRPGKEIIERNAYSEMFLEIACRTPPTYKGLLKQEDIKDKHAERTWGIGLTRGELKKSIADWNRLIGEKSKNKESSYSRKLANLQKSGLIEKVPGKVFNKKFRYVLSQNGFRKELRKLLGEDRVGLLSPYWTDKHFSTFCAVNPELRYFDDGIWRLFIGYLMEIFAHRIRARDFQREGLKISPHSKSADMLMEQDTQVVQSTIKEFFIHFIFREGIKYYSHAVTNRSVKFPFGGSDENSFYGSFGILCWNYIGNNILKFYLADSFLEIHKTSSDNNKGLNKEKRLEGGQNE